MAFAALGAAEFLAVDPGHRPARALLTDYAASLPAPGTDAAWPWPEPRLTYANAVLPEAMIAAGAALEDAALCSAAWTCWPGCLRSKRRAAICRRRPAGAEAPATSARIRSAAHRGVHTRRRVRAGRHCRRQPDLGRRRQSRRRLVPGRQRRREADVGPRRPVVDTTDFTPTPLTATRERNRPWR